MRAAAALKAVPRPLARIVAKAMNRVKTKRYHSMAAFEAELLGFLDPIWGSLPKSPKAFDRRARCRRSALD